MLIAWHLLDSLLPVFLLNGASEKNIKTPLKLNLLISFRIPFLLVNLKKERN